MNPITHIDVGELETIGGRYEDRYGAYLKVFERIAQTSGRILVTHAPWSWYPLLYHLQCSVARDMRYWFDHCRIVEGACQATLNSNQLPKLDRTAVEVLCSFRPETVDALWKCDMQWDPHIDRVRQYEQKQEFIVTTNGAYHRPEVLAFMSALRGYKPTKKKVVIVPCAADKPYPSPLHRKIMAILPDDYYMMNATGVLGLVPQDLWPIMPWYDSGIPNEWRLFKIAADYFDQYDHDRIVVFSDYYAYTIQQAMRSIEQEHKVTFIVAPDFYYDYLPLMQDNYMDALKSALSVK
jgi:hypothetical protein